MAEEYKGTEIREDEYDIIFSELKNILTPGELDSIKTKFIREPEAFGIIKQHDGWYIYNILDRGYADIVGPFDIKGIVIATAYKFYKSEKLDRNFTDEELEIYIENHYPAPFLK